MVAKVELETKIQESTGLLIVMSPRGSIPWIPNDITISPAIFYL